MRRKRTLAVTAAAAAAAVTALAMVQPASAASALGTAASALGTAASTASAGAQPLTAAQAAALSADVNTPVIVLLKDQPAVPADNTPAATSRANAITSNQSPLVSELSQVHAQHVRTYHLTNAVAATVSKAEAARLASNPEVAEVVPDEVIKAPAQQDATSTGSASTPATSELPGECPAPGQTMLEPEALADTHTDSDDPTAKTARSLGFTGAGVKVAYLADGVDINNPDFIRPDGSHVFADYQDFTGDGPNAPTDGGEAFIDSSAIAAQGREVYNVQNFGAHPLPTPCDIRIEGMAPGASLYGFKIFGQNNTSTLSAALQGIDYAVNTDHVNVINESFGTNPFPDNGAQDALEMFNSAAVAAGVSVVASSGDAGTSGTQGNPSTDSAVISAGASTTFRWNVQTDYAAAGTFATTGWLNDNVSSLSSSGVNQAGNTVDLLAPGDGSFALCTANAAIYTECTNFTGQPSTVERSGGTSESSPLTAGAAALVIQAYRQSHNGVTPTPALVKQILTSTADDLTELADEQGAGLLDSYKAVQAALSVKDANGSPKATGSTLLVSKNQLTATGAANSTQHWQLQVTNTGANPQTVNLGGRSFGPARHQQTGSVTLSDTSSPHFADWAGNTDNYGTLNFTVPPNTPRLSASIAYPGDPNASPNARVRLILIDPLGRFAAHSLPQGVGNYGNVDVRLPAAGKWTAIIYSIGSAKGGTVGTVQFQATTNDTTGYGSVSPSVLHLAPGQSSTVTVTANTPATPGDSASSLVLNAGAGGQTSVPIVLRSLVNLNTGGAFAGTLFGGNGRQTDLGQENYYAFDVSAGQRDLAAQVSLANDPGDNVLAYLVDPQGNQVAIGTNALTNSYNPTAFTATQTNGLATNVYVRDPAPGQWRLLVNFVGAVAGNEISEPFTGNITLNKVDAHATGLPDSASTTLPAGKPVTVPVTVHNTGNAPEDVFLDPRLNTLTGVQLAGVTPTSNLPMPLPIANAAPEWLVPSETQAVAALGSATVPTSFDFGPLTGDPDVPSPVNGTNSAGAIAGNPLPAGPWLLNPAEVGPAGQNGWPSGTLNLTMVALTKAFDATASSTATDLWATSVHPATSFSLVTVNPGQTVTIPLTITPTGAKGTVVQGVAYVDDLVVANTGELTTFNFNDLNAFEPTGDELTGIPYQYRIG